MRIYVWTCILTVCIAGQAFAFSVNDDFNDNAPDIRWNILEDTPTRLQVVEQNQRLDILSNNSTNINNDALYLSAISPTPFWMSTAFDFEIAIDYFFLPAPEFFQSGATGIVFGVGRDLDGTDSAAIGYGIIGFNETIIIPGLGPVTIDTTLYRAGTGSRNNDFETTDEYPDSAPDDGTFVIRYDATLDRLFMSIEGLAEVQMPEQPVADWGADQLLVAFGGRGNGFDLESGEAWFDNFEVRSGTINIPEPTSLALLSLAGLTLLRRRRENA